MDSTKPVVKYLNAFLDILFPDNIKCVVCEKEINSPTDKTFCDKCRESLPFINNHACIKCGSAMETDGKVCAYCKNNKRFFDKSISVFNYSPPVSFLIHSFKYKNARYLDHHFATLMAPKILGKFDGIAFVPLHKKKQAQRGYNQCELLCDELSKILNIPKITNLIRVENTIAQTQLNRKLREENLSTCFAVLNAKEIKDKKILLVDDVFTTGSTLNECSRVLKSAGASIVSCITIAHSSPKHNF